MIARLGHRLLKRRHAEQSVQPMFLRADALLLRSTSMVTAEIDYPTMSATPAGKIASRFGFTELLDTHSTTAFATGAQRVHSVLRDDPPRDMRGDRPYGCAHALCEPGRLCFYSKRSVCGGSSVRRVAARIHKDTQQGDGDKQ